MNLIIIDISGRLGDVPLIIKIDMGDKCHMRQIFLLYHLDWGSI